MALLVCVVCAGARGQERPVRLAVAGLVHGHVDGFLFGPARGRRDVQIVGIYERDAGLARRYAQRYNYPESVLYTDLGKMLDATKPDGVATFTSTYDHAAVVEECAAHHVPVMMEKPLAVSVEHARRIESAARRGAITVVVNYETSWYPSHAAIWDLVKRRQAIGDIRKMVAMDGHEGPKEIGVGPEFLGWLTDPKLNGAGALFDFGCYGANLMTWLMDGHRPISVTAVTQHVKPDVYPRVDDEATILVEYPKAIGIIQASWNWPFGRKDLEVYGARGYAIATGGRSLHERLPGGHEETPALEPMPEHYRDPLSYFVAVIRGQVEPDGLSSLANNVVVTEILDAARQSARTGRRVVLPKGG
jgi:predicted dehydrogenase